MNRAVVWAWQEYESPKAYRAFEFYRDMWPGRSLSRAYHAWSLWKYKGRYGDRVRPVPGIWKRWSRENRWVARAKEFDLRHWRAVEAAIASGEIDLSNVKPTERDPETVELMDYFNDQWAASNWDAVDWAESSDTVPADLNPGGDLEQALEQLRELIAYLARSG